MMPKVVAIVQARMGSSRLPGKMLLEIAERPLVDHVLERLFSGRTRTGIPDAVVLATSDEAGDSPLADHVAVNWPEVVIVRGSERDVLSRFASAVTLTEPDVVIRVTGDCPLLNVDALPVLMSEHLSAKADVTNYRPGFEYADKGVEVVSPGALLGLANDPATSMSDREHVTAGLYRQPETYRVHYVQAEPWLQRGDVRLTIDTPEDLEFFRALFRCMEKSAADIALHDVLAFLDQRPDIAGINAGAGRKSTMHEPARLGFRCDGGAELGLGHVVGCLRMAQVARGLGLGIEFVTRRHSAVLSMISGEGYAVEALPTDISPAEDIKRLIAKSKESGWSAVVINMSKSDLERYQHHFEDLKRAGLKVIFMDNPVPPGWRLGDLVINALPHPDYPDYDPADHPRCFDGLEYFLTSDQAARTQHERASVSPEVERVLVAMGGGEAAQSTLLVLRALGYAGFRGYVDVVLGNAARDRMKVNSALSEAGLWADVSVGVSNLQERMIYADVGFTGLGLTTYEMASVGLPAIIVANSMFNAQVAELYCKQHGAAWFVGTSGEVSCYEIAHAFSAIDRDVDLRRRMSMAGMARIGANRETLVSELQKILVGEAS